jgi:hypothetical protein
MKKWYITNASQERTAITEDQFDDYVRASMILPTTLVWQEGMNEWLAASEVRPDLFTQSSGINDGSTAMAQAVVEPLLRRRAWLFAAMAGLLCLSLLDVVTLLREKSWTGALLFAFGLRMVLTLGGTGALFYWWSQLGQLRGQKEWGALRRGSVATSHVMIIVGALGLICSAVVIFHFINLVAKRFVSL